MATINILKTSTKLIRIPFKKNQFFAEYKYASSIIILFLVLIIITASYAEEPCCTVSGQADTLENAILSAKRAIIEKGLGEFVSSRSMSVDGQSVINIAASFSEGYIQDFKVLSKRKVDDGWEVTAQGSVTEKDGTALIDRYREIGKPRILIHIQETLNGKLISTAESTANHLLAANLKDFEIVDWKDLDQNLLKQANTKKIFQSDSARQLLVQKLALNNAEILILGICEVSTNTMPMNPNMNSIQSVIRYKMVDISTNRILAADVANGTYMHINIRQGTKMAVDRAVQILHPRIITQVSEKWKAGGLIVLKIAGIKYEQFQKKELVGNLRVVPGVSNVIDRSLASNGQIQLDVEAFISAPKIYAAFSEVFRKQGLRISNANVKGNSISMYLH